MRVTETVRTKHTCCDSANFRATSSASLRARRMPSYAATPFLEPVPFPCFTFFFPLSPFTSPAPLSGELVPLRRASASCTLNSTSTNSGLRTGTGWPSQLSAPSFLLVSAFPAASPSIFSFSTKASHPSTTSFLCFDASSWTMPSTSYALDRPSSWAQYLISGPISSENRVARAWSRLVDAWPASLSKRPLATLSCTNASSKSSRNRRNLPFKIRV